jgi:hypothetical protein
MAEEPDVRPAAATAAFKGTGWDQQQLGYLAFGSKPFVACLEQLPLRAAATSSHKRLTPARQMIRNAVLRIGRGFAQRGTITPACCAPPFALPESCLGCSARSLQIEP